MEVRGSTKQQSGDGHGEGGMRIAEITEGVELNKVGPAYVHPISSQTIKSFWSIPIALSSCCYITPERKWDYGKQVSGFGRSSD